MSRASEDALAFTIWLCSIPVILAANVAAASVMTPVVLFSTIPASIYGFSRLTQWVLD